MVHNTGRETEEKAQNKFEKLWLKGYVIIFER